MRVTRTRPLLSRAKYRQPDLLPFVFLLSTCAGIININLTEISEMPRDTQVNGHVYDPDQDPEEKRAVRREYRQLAKDRASR